MSKPSDMPYEERKRQYAAMRRQIYREAPPALLAKYSLAPDAERFQMLRQWMLNPDLDSIFVEEKYVQWTESLRSDRYTTVTLFQLEKLYGKSKETKEFIKELIKGQKGTPHPQAPTSTKGRMFKVLKEVVEENSQGNRTDKLASVGGRCRDEGAKKLLAQQLGGLQDPEFLNMATGQIKSKKMPKQKTPEQISQLKGLINTIPAILNDIKEYKVRGQHLCRPDKENIKDVENDVKDGRKRISGVKASKKTKKAKESDHEGESSGEMFASLYKYDQELFRQRLLGPPGALEKFWDTMKDTTLFKEHPVLSNPALVEITRTDLVWTGSNVDERLRLAFHSFTRMCKLHGVRNRGQIFCEKHLYPAGVRRSYPTLAQKHFNGAEGVILCRFLKGVCLSIAESYPQDTHAALLGCFRHFRHKWHFF
ncbi:unnamed protein product [Durusdinium trenchii]|uniref:Uncharacterized protein n=1 Tax=Durusdinium trenchii TaxID=1381693 RepID=A0ABP0S7M4_9DINO